ncbi:MAG: transcription factor [Desulfurococcales archaeon]|nr:transcription factor [Desulfurococcales archaeon]
MDGKSSKNKVDEKEILKELDVLIKLLFYKEKVYKRSPILANITPEEASLIFRILYEKAETKGLSDEELEQITGMRETQIRRILLLLLENKLVTYQRGRTKTGETRFFWRINKSTLNLILLSRKKNVLGKLKTRYQFEEENEIYVCPKCGARYTFPEAFEYEFVCPRCGGELELDEDREINLKILKRIIENLQREIKRDETQL